jgi:hypothetical protein
MKQPKILSVTSTEYCTPVFSVDCNGVKCENGCPLAKEANAEQVRAWLREQFADAGDSDLSKVKVRDWIYTIKAGWERVICVCNEGAYPVRALSTYTADGKRFGDDEHPSAWVRPPACLNAPPKPQPAPEFKKGDRVLVRDSENEKWHRKYFSHYEPDNSLPYYCFAFGRDEWAGDGETNNWKFCKKWEEVTKFKKGDKVVVWNLDEGMNERRIFSHYDPNRAFPYVCFKYGADEWGSRGLVDYWAYCKKWEEK